MEKEAKAIKRKEEQNQIRGKTTLSDLPLEILLHILVSLPAKALFDCRCVCKSWLTLVRDPRLAKMHFIRSSQNENNPSIIFQSYNQNTYILDDVVDPNLAVMLELPFLKSERFWVLDSCNGLIFVKIGTYSYVCNPITGEFVKIPGLGFDCGYDYPYSAFCYHPLTDEYKILFGSRHDQFSGYRKILIHTLGSNSWRKKRDTKSVSKNMCWDVKMNGALHWLDSPMRLPIFSFDIGKEEFGVIEHPAELSEMRCILVVLGGCLSLSYTRDDVQIIEIWLMKEYGVKESWSKQFVIEQKGVFMNYTDLARPLCILNNGLILIEMYGSLVSYDPKSKIATHANIRLISKHHVLDGPYNKFCQALIHMGSFVSLRDISGRLKGQQQAKRGRQKKR